MDHLQLSEINKRNAQTAKAMGNLSLESSYLNLARYHESEFARQYHEDACATHWDEVAMQEAYSEDDNYQQEHQQAA